MAETREPHAERELGGSKTFQLQQPALSFLFLPNHLYCSNNGSMMLV